MLDLVAANAPGIVVALFCALTAFGLASEEVMEMADAGPTCAGSRWQNLMQTSNTCAVIAGP
jgi:hypothetical protein